MTESYMEFQKQAMNSFQFTFGSIVENTNNIIRNNQVYCTKLPVIYSKMAITFTENTTTLSKMINDIDLANVNTIKKFYNFSQIR